MPTTTELGFQAFDLPEHLLTSLRKLDIHQPTPIQEHGIPVALSGRDVVGVAQTGTGKTLAFALPIMAREQRALILAPTRELALQIEDSFKKLGAKTVVLIGGESLGRQLALLRRGPQIVVATPGRLLDHMNQKNIHLDKTQVVVLDEGDRMLDMGFLPAINKIMDRLPSERQTMLFSATMPREVAEISAKYLRDPLRIEVSPSGTATELVEQSLYVVPFAEKGDMLQRLLDQNRGTALVFARTRHGARKVAKAVRGMGHTAAELHSDRTLSQRKHALEGFKKGEYRVLVATDIAARGIDVKEISLVVNYDLPDCAEDYVHRIGRTGRAGSSGLAATIATPEQGKDIREIERIIGTRLPVMFGEIERPRPPVHSGFRRSGHRSAGRPGNPAGGRPGNRRR
jgi:ATP-dependent RNA helicase RhlE